MHAPHHSAPKLALIAVVALLLAGCPAKQPPSLVSKAPEARTLQTAPESAAEIQVIMQQARSGGEIDVAIAELDRLISSAEGPVREEAEFRKVELMLEQQLPGALSEANALIARYPEHALIPYTHFWIGRYWLQLDEAGRALEQMRTALEHRRLSRELADHIFDQAPSVASAAPEAEAVSWFLAAARINEHARESWLRMAARRASMPTIEQIHHNGVLSDDLMPLFDLHAGRAQLMIGDRDAVARIAELLAATKPQHAVTAQLKAWASGEFKAATIGVMLPLSGKYARFGQEALRGLRIALAESAGDAYITLRVEDTASDAQMAVAAYKRLSDESVNMIIGPLLSESSEALIPYLKPNLPVISLTGRIDLASRSDALFIHTLSPLAQVYVMADYARQHEIEKIVVISDNGPDQSEAEMFIKSFESMDGEVMQWLQLDRAQLDQRSRLRELRYLTDDEELLFELDEDAAVYLPEMALEKVLPNGFDAVYLALDGKQVSLLAGQLAYADISGVPLLGSSRWQDEHLLDDRGRYLSTARFAASSASVDVQSGMDDEMMRRFRFFHREVWGNPNTSQLMALAYDTMRIATMMTSRMGLSSSELGFQLRDPEGYPAMTGHVRFDEQGVGQKQLDIFRIKRGKIVPAG